MKKTLGYYTHVAIHTSNGLLYKYANLLIKFDTTKHDFKKAVELSTEIVMESVYLYAIQLLKGEYFEKKILTRQKSFGKYHLTMRIQIHN